MIYLWDAIRVTLIFALFYLIGPGLFMPRTWPPRDRFALGFTATVSVAVILAQSLSALGVYEPTALVLIAAGLLIYRFTRGSSQGKPLERSWLVALDKLEEMNGAFWQIAWGSLVQRFSQWRAALVAVGWSRWSTWAVGAVVLIWAAWLRYYQYLHHAFLGASDGYVHLAWVKYLESQQIFHDGIYPYGYHAILSVLGSMTQVDRLLLLRFAGPIGGLLLVLSIAYAAARLRVRPGASVAAMALFGLGFGSPLPANAFRQSQPLPQEFAAAFVLPGTVWAWEYLTKGERTSGLLALLALFLATSIHTYALVYLALAISLLALVGLLMRIVQLRRVLYLGLGSAGAGLLGALPLIIATLLGRPWHSSLSYVTSQIQLLSPAAGLARLHSGNPMLDLGLLLALLLAVGSFVMARKGEHGRHRAVWPLAVSLLLVILYTQTFGRTGIPVLMDPVRSGLFFSLILALAVGILLDRLMELLHAGHGLQAMVAASLVAVQVLTWRPKPATWTQQEYDDAVTAYMRISRSYPRMAWTIVAPVEQYSQVLGMGHHQQLGSLLTQVTAADVEGESFRFPIEDPDVFVFIEKWPLGSSEPVEPDPWAEVQLDAYSDPQQLLAHYQEPSLRSQMERRAWGVMEAYRVAHPGEVSVWYETDQFLVYHITQPEGSVVVTRP